MDTVIKSENINNLEQFNCKGCGASLSVINPRAKYIACQYCGSVLDANSDEHEELSKLADPIHHQSFSFLEIGMTARIKGHKHQVIARTRWLQSYQERWEEEGEVGYSNEMWVYDEWLLMSEYHTYFYLIEDKKGFYVSNEVIPTDPKLPTDNVARLSVFKEHRSQPIQEIGSAEVLYFEGESNYEIKIGDTIGFASYNHKSKIINVEWRLDNDTGEIKEIEFFIERKLEKQEVLEIFDQNEAIDKILGKRYFYNFLGWTSVAVALAFGLMTIFSLIKSEESIFEQNFSVSDFSNEQQLISNTFELKKGLYRIRLDGANMPDNSSIYALAFFMNEDSLMLNRIETNIYSYSGYDSEGYYTESYNGESKLVRVHEAGTYHSYLYAQSENALSASVRLSIQKGVLLSRYFIIGLVIMVIFIIVFFSLKKKA